ncbi:MAG: hypothetical protein ACPG31_09460 [Planctomycetota bacterium]
MSFRPEFHSLALLSLLVGLGACSGAHPESTAPEPADIPIPDEKIEEEVVLEAAPQALDLAALEQTAQTDPSGALNQMDKLLGDHAENPALWLLFGQTTLDLFAQKQAQGTLSPGLASDLIADAQNAYEQALRAGADREAGLLGLVRSYRTQGDAGAAWDAALGLYDQVAPQLEAGEDVDTASLVAIGRAGLDISVAAIQVGEAAPANAYMAVLSLETAMQAGAQEAVLPLSDLHAWLGNPRAAIDTLAAGLHTAPTDLALFGRLQNLGAGNRNQQVAVLQQLRTDVPGQATTLWYLGEALYLQGRETRAAADYMKSIDCWNAAEEAFQQAMSLEPTYETTCRDWLHLVRTQRGWTLRDEGRLADAAACLINTLEADPTRLEPESSPHSLRLAIDAITGDYFNANRLKDARNFLRRVCAIHDDNSDWTNNLGFFCRDLGVEAAMAGDMALAQQYFEESWEAYSRTVELSPDEARLVNDRALIAVYYLDDHWELAEQELHRSIALGEKTLAEMGPDVPETEREYFDMAVGDAWENLAFLYLNRYEEIGESETYIKNSLKHFPFDQRDGIPPLQQKLEELRNR